MCKDVRQGGIDVQTELAELIKWFCGFISAVNLGKPSFKFF